MDEFDKEYEERYDIPGFLKSRLSDKIAEDYINILTEDLCNLKQYNFEKRASNARYCDMCLYDNTIRVSYAIRKSYTGHCKLPYFQYDVVCDECYCSDQDVREKNTCKCWGSEDCVRDGECYVCTGRCDHKLGKCKCTPLSSYLENSKIIKEIRLFEAQCRKYSDLHEAYLKTEREKEEVIYRLKNAGLIDRTKVA